MAETPRFVGQPKPPSLGKNSSIVRRPPFRRLVSLAIAVTVLLVIVLMAIAGNVQKWLWMRQLGYIGIFWTLLSVQWVMFCSAFVFAFLYLWLNFRQAARNSANFGGTASAGRLADFASVADLRQIGVDVSPGF